MTAKHKPPHSLGTVETISMAHKDGLRTLYKFMAYPKDGAAPNGNAERRKRVEALLRDGEFYFATAQTERIRYTMGLEQRS